MIRVNAVLGKELTTRMRGRRAAIVITGYLALLAVVSLLVLTGNDTPHSYTESAALGQNLFQWLAGFQMVLIIFITPASTADAMSGERQRQTLDLLLVTRLSSFSIVLGKLAAALAFDVLLILCSLPLFSLVFLFGGVSPDQFVSEFVVFLATTLVLGSMSLFISTIMRRSGASVVVSMLCTLALTFGLLILSIYLLAATDSGGVGPQTLPVVAYLDPIFGFLDPIPDLTKGYINSLSYFTGGPLDLALWADQVIVDVILSALFILGCVRLLRPRWSPHRGQRSSRVPQTVQTTQKEGNV